MTGLQYSPRSGLDVFLPDNLPANATIPALVFCHGGGLISGNRTFPKAGYSWLTSSAASHGCAFITISYPLLLDDRQQPLFTAKDMLEDAPLLVPFLQSEECHAALGHRIDTSRLGIIGSSAGCYIARLIIQESSIKFKAAGLLWGEGGSFFLDHWVFPNTDAFISRPNNALRSIMARGEYLDLLLGLPGFAHSLAKYPSQDRPAHVPSNLRQYFPELDCSRMPSTYLLHGSEDTLVLPEESINTAQSMRRLGKCHRLELLEGSEHSLWPSGVGHDRTEEEREAAQRRCAEWVVNRI